MEIDVPSQTVIHRITPQMVIQDLSDLRQDTVEHRDRLRMLLALQADGGVSAGLVSEIVEAFCAYTRRSVTEKMSPSTLWKWRQNLGIESFKDKEKVTCFNQRQLALLQACLICSKTGHTRSQFERWINYYAKI